MKSIALGALIGAATLISSVQAETVLRFSAIPDEDTTAQDARFKPVADYLAKKLNIKVEFVASPNYGASVQKFAGGDIQLAWFGGVTGVQARQRVKGAQAIVSGEADLAFKSYFIAHTSTGLTKSDEFPTAIKDLKFTYGSQNSTSGCIMPTHFLMEASGKTPQDFFTQEFGFSGSHDKTAELVNAGTFQAGALNFKTYEKGIASGKLSKEKCVVIWETPTYADYNMTAHPVLDKQFGEGFIKKLQKALVECDDEAALAALKREKLVAVENSTFDGIASVMAKVNFKK
jgi:phosphonate transport system substrate-binding protein